MLPSPGPWDLETLNNCYSPCFISELPRHSSLGQPYPENVNERMKSQGLEEHKNAKGSHQVFRARLDQMTKDGHVSFPVPTGILVRKLGGRSLIV